MLTRIAVVTTERYTAVNDDEIRAAMMAALDRWSMGGASVEPEF